MKKMNKNNKRRRSQNLTVSVRSDSFRRTLTSRLKAKKAVAVVRMSSNNSHLFKKIKRKAMKKRRAMRRRTLRRRRMTAGERGKRRNRRLIRSQRLNSLLMKIMLKTRSRGSFGIRRRNRMQRETKIRTKRS